MRAGASRIPRSLSGDIRSSCGNSASELGPGVLADFKGARGLSERCALIIIIYMHGETHVGV